MGEERTIVVALDEDMADVVDDAVVHGGYATDADVVREALALWQRQRADTPDNIERLRHAWIEGLASGPPIAVTDDWFEDIKQRGHDRLEALRAER